MLRMGNLRPLLPGLTGARALIAGALFLLSLAPEQSRALELVKPRLLIPKDSYEEFMIRGPITLSYVVTVLNGTDVDAVLLDKANFIRFANKGDAEFVEEASTLDAKTAHALHYRLGEGLHYLVIDNSKEFGSTKPSSDVEVSLSINILGGGPDGPTSVMGHIVAPTWVVAFVLAALMASASAACVFGSLLLARRRAKRQAGGPDGDDPDLVMVRRARHKSNRAHHTRLGPLVRGSKAKDSGDEKDITV